MYTEVQESRHPYTDQKRSRKMGEKFKVLWDTVLGHQSEMTYNKAQYYFRPSHWDVEK